MNTERDTCSVCGAHLTYERITFMQTIGDSVYVVTGVPAQVCPQCGEQYFEPDTVDALQELIETGATPQKTIQVPVYQFPDAVAL